MKMTELVSVVFMTLEEPHYCFYFFVIYTRYKQHKWRAKYDTN